MKKIITRKELGQTFEKFYNSIKDPFDQLNFFIRTQNNVLKSREILLELVDLCYEFFTEKEQLLAKEILKNTISFLSKKHSIQRNESLFGTKNYCKYFNENALFDPIDFTSIIIIELRLKRGEKIKEFNSIIKRHLDDFDFEIQILNVKDEISIEEVREQFSKQYKQ